VPSNLAAREAARRLRSEQGLSIVVIAEMLDVSKSSVHRWVDGIGLTEDQLRRLADTPGRRQNRSALATGRSDEHRRLRRIWQQEGACLADSGNRLFREGCMLYWAEGTKSRHHVALSNSDPELIRHFMRFLRACFAVRNRDMKILDQLLRRRETCPRHRSILARRCRTGP
jgi:predicted transcriptional regulator